MMLIYDTGDANDWTKQTVVASILREALLFEVSGAAVTGGVLQIIAKPIIANELVKVQLAISFPVFNGLVWSLDEVKQEDMVRAYVARFSFFWRRFIVRREGRIIQRRIIKYKRLDLVSSI